MVAVAVALLVAVLALRRPLGPRSTLWMLALCACAPLVVVYSRAGHYISVSVLHGVICFASLLWLLRRWDVPSALVTGVVLGCSLYQYQLSWFVPVFAGAMFLASPEFWRRPGVIRVVASVAIAGCATALPGFIWLDTGFDAVNAQTFDRAVWNVPGAGDPESPHERWAGVLAIVPDSVDEAGLEAFVARVESRGLTPTQQRTVQGETVVWVGGSRPRGGGHGRGGPPGRVARPRLRGSDLQEPLRPAPPDAGTALLRLELGVVRALGRGSAHQSPARAPARGGSHPRVASAARARRAPAADLVGGGRAAAGRGRWAGAAAHLVDAALRLRSHGAPGGGDRRRAPPQPALGTRGGRRPLRRDVRGGRVHQHLPLLPGMGSPAGDSGRGRHDPGLRQGAQEATRRRGGADARDVSRARQVSRRRRGVPGNGPRCSRGP